MRGLSPVDQVLFGLAMASLCFTAGYFLTGLELAFRTGFAIEDGPIEWGTAILLFAASLVLLRNAVVLRARRGMPAALLTAGYALIFLLGAGEEISWGHRIFGWQAGDFFLEHNAQQETNLHNLVLGEVRLVNTVFGPILSTVLLLYLVGLPLLDRRVAALRGLADALVVPVPDTRHMWLALAATAVILALPMLMKWEVYEFVFATLAVSIFLAPRNAAQVT